MEHSSAERNTRQRRAIRDAFERAKRPLSSDEAFVEAKAEIDGLGKATVYRAIRALLDDGWLTSVDVPGQGVLYELAGKGHHHHFFCTSCRRVYELDGCRSDISIALPRGFRADEHELTVRGTCAACRSAERALTRSNA